MNRKMSKAEAKAYEDLAKACRRVQMFETRRKNARGKPKLTKKQRCELQRKRREFAIACQLPSSIDAWRGGVIDMWVDAARTAQAEGLYSFRTSASDIACSLRRYKEIHTESLL